MATKTLPRPHPLHIFIPGMFFMSVLPSGLAGPDGETVVERTHRHRFREETSISVACDVVSGTINALFLIGRVQALAGTDYGRLLLLKITLFAAMVGLAGINRQYLLPRLFGDAGMDQGSRAVRWLVRSALVEIAFGFGVIIVVGMLGIMAPASDMPAHLH